MTAANRVERLGSSEPFDDSSCRRRCRCAASKLIDETDLSYPIILAADGAVMDGRHRIARAARLGLSEIEARQFLEDPEPDYIGRAPDDLPY